MADLARRLRRDPTLPVRVLVLAAVVLTPTVFDLGTVRPFDQVKATTILFFGWIALGTWAALVLRGRSRSRRFTMAWLALAFLLVNTVGVIFSSTRYTSLYGWFGRYSGWIEIATMIGIFYVVGCVYRERRERLPELIGAIAVASIVVTLYILIQRAGLDPIRWAKPSGGVPGQPYFGTMGNANFAGGFLGLTAPCLYYAYHRSRENWQRALVGVWALGLLSGLWFTSARNGMFALGAVVALLLVVYRRRVPVILQAGFVAAIVVALALAFVVIVHPGSKKPPAALRRVDVLRSKTIEVRVEWWKAGVRMFLHRPVFGWGPETYVTHNARFLSARAAKLGDSETADKPHNVYVEHLAHTGVLGFAAWIGLIIVALRRGLRRLRDAPEERVLGTTLLALLAAYLGQAFFSIDVMAIVLTGWVVIGAIAAWADPPDDTDARPPRREPVTAGRRVLSGVAIVLGLVLATALTAPLKAEHEAKTASRLQASGSVDDVLDHYELARRWNPWEPFYHGLPGNYLEQKGLTSDDRSSRRAFLEQAIAEFEEMDRLQGGQYALWKYSVGVAMGDLAVAGGASFEEAEQWLDDARELAPYDWRIVTAQADLLNKWAVATKDKREAPGLLCRALRYAEVAVDYRKAQGEAQLALGRTLARIGHLEEAIGPLTKAARHGDARAQANPFLKEVRRLMDLSAKKRPPVVDCP